MHFLLFSALFRLQVSLRSSSHSLNTFISNPFLTVSPYNPQAESKFPTATFICRTRDHTRNSRNKFFYNNLFDKTTTSLSTRSSFSSLKKTFMSNSSCVEAFTAGAATIRATESGEEELRQI
ncbi:hypothetical protein V8G54_026300 [Vigna mungo]|uniref:Secreted protein n=1 Tax=Vigna mungo TaxID=3915 RepID=A0AAQ3N0S6_VIGMU